MPFTKITLDRKPESPQAQEGWLLANMAKGQKGETVERDRTKQIA